MRLRTFVIALLVILPLFAVADGTPTASEIVVTPTGAAPAPTGGAPFPTGGAPAPDGGTSALTNPLNASTLQELIQEILVYLQYIGGIFLTLMLIYTGFMFVSARGNQEKLTRARTALLWTVIGGIILLGASAIAAAIANTAQSL